MVEKLESDSKAAHFYLECSGLVRLARARQREAQAAKAKLRQAKDTIRNLQGDVDSTSTNYESQVSSQLFRSKKNSNYPAKHSAPFG